MAARATFWGVILVALLVSTVQASTDLNEVTSQCVRWRMLNPYNLTDFLETHHPYAGLGPRADLPFDALAKEARLEHLHGDAPPPAPQEPMSAARLVALDAHLVALYHGFGVRSKLKVAERALIESLQQSSTTTLHDHWDPLVLGDSAIAQEARIAQLPPIIAIFLARAMQNRWHIPNLDRHVAPLGLTIHVDTVVALITHAYCTFEPLLHETENVDGGAAFFAGMALDFQFRKESRRLFRRVLLSDGGQSPLRALALHSLALREKHPYTQHSYFARSAELGLAEAQRSLARNLFNGIKVDTTVGLLHQDVHTGKTKQISDFVDEQTDEHEPRASQDGDEGPSDYLVFPDVETAYQWCNAAWKQSNILTCECAPASIKRRRDILDRVAEDMEEARQRNATIHKDQTRLSGKNAPSVPLAQGAILKLWEAFT